MKRAKSFERLFVAVKPLTALLIGLAAFATVLACDTPVYRYAMYRWEPTAYEVYHFHNGNISDEFNAISEQLAVARNERLSPANVDVYPIDLKEDPELKTVPRDVRRHWEQKVKDGAQAPATLIVNPLGYVVHFGPLEQEQVAKMINSPLRKQIGNMLGKGHAGVYVLVAGKDEELNKAASEATEKLVADVNAGKIQLYAGPDAYDPLSPDFKLPQEKSKREPANGDSESEESNSTAGEKAEAASDADETKPSGDADSEDSEPDEEAASHSVAILSLSGKKLQQDDPWLFKSLMAVEDDLYEFQDEPMLFVVYGRGRALPPYIGKGIVYDNLVEITDFVTSACSCTVKDQNPGVDLLMAYDWESASAAVAERFGAEEGNEESLADLFPQLIVPATITDDVAQTGGVDSPAEDEPATATADDSTTAKTQQPAEQSSESGEDPANLVAVAASETEEIGDEPDKQKDSASKNTTNADQITETVVLNDTSSSTSAGPNLLVTLGVGMGVALVALLAATFIILKPQH